MALSPFKLNNFLQEAEAHITQQFKDKRIFKRYLQLLLEGPTEVLNVFRQLMQERDIDSAIGEQLDILGRIVGQDRILIGADSYKNFGFLEDDLASTFSSVNNQAVGGYWYSFGKAQGGNVTLNDEQYRLFIRAKIKKNTTTATIDEVLDFLNFVFGLKGIVTENGGGEATIYVSRRLSTFEKSLINMVDASGSYFVPRPLGVKLNIEEPSASGSLGFLGTPFALGMVSLYAISPIGGIFGSVFAEEE